MGPRQLLCRIHEKPLWKEGYVLIYCIHKLFPQERWVKPPLPLRVVGGRKETGKFRLLEPTDVTSSCQSP